MLGHRIFENKIEHTIIEPENEKVFHIHSAKGANATMIQTTEGFVVRKGSIFADPVVDSFSSSFQKIRDRLFEKQIINFKDGELILSENYIFSSPSTAAALVMGRNANGLSEWKLINGKSLKDVESLDQD